MASSALEDSASGGSEFVWLMPLGLAYGMKCCWE